MLLREVAGGELPPNLRRKWMQTVKMTDGSWLVCQKYENGTITLRFHDAELSRDLNASFSGDFEITRGCALPSCITEALKLRRNYSATVSSVHSK